MKVNDYERGYVAVQKAMKVVENMEDVVNFLRTHPSKNFTVPEIGRAAIPNYRQKILRELNGKILEDVDWHHRGDAVHLGHILKTLLQCGCVKADHVDGDPIEIETNVYVEDTPAPNIPEFIEVHDNAGNTYQMRNPAYNGYQPITRNAHWEKRKQTIIPKIKVYSWCGD